MDRWKGGDEGVEGSLYDREVEDSVGGKDGGGGGCGWIKGWRIACEMEGLRVM